MFIRLRGSAGPVPFFLFFLPVVRVNERILLENDLKLKASEREDAVWCNSCGSVFVVLPNWHARLRTMDDPHDYQLALNEPKSQQYE